uniref:Centrosomal protein of 68 kDa n=1 Tax=Jaculus jaculus TaxID=51337 RepID=A0A8C5KU19_JACJA
MALGKEEAEVEAPVDTDTKAQAWGSRWSCGEQGELLPRGPEPERALHVEAEGEPAWTAAAGPSCGSGDFLPQALSAGRKPVVDGAKAALSCSPSPASVGPGDVPHRVGSQEGESKPPAPQELLQSVRALRAAAVRSGRDAGTEDDGSPVASPHQLGLSQPPHTSAFLFLSQENSVVSPDSPQLSSGSVSASSMGSNLQDQQEKAQLQSGSLAKASLGVGGPRGPSAVEPGSQLQWSCQPGGDAATLGRRHLSFQAEYWACVLPDSLPPSPDRHSPLWNPNKEYEDLLDYTYPLRPGPRPPKPVDRHALVDPVMQDSGIDLDSFSVSPASTLKSPTNVTPNCSPAEASTLPFTGAKKSSLKFQSLGVSQKQGTIGLTSWGHLSLTPRTPGSGHVPWESRAAALRGTKDCVPTGMCLKMDSPQMRTRGRGQPSPRSERASRAGRSVQCAACAEPGWKSDEEAHSDDEYLALPARLAQVSSLASCVRAVPTFASPPARAAQRQSSLEVSDSDGPASPTLDSTHTQCPPGAVLQEPEGRKPCCLRPRDSTGESSPVSQALGRSCGLLKTPPSPAPSDRWPLSELYAEGQPKASLVQCVQTFCCQLEELIRWLYDVTDGADLSSPSPGPSLASLRSSLQLYRQFKKDVDEHQSLTASVLEKGELLLQCLLDSTPALKDVLGRIAKQSGELENHADRLYDSILASLDMLAGWTLIPDKPTAARVPA